MPATEYDKTTKTLKLAKVSFNDAQEACFKMGREILKKNDLKKHLVMDIRGIIKDSISSTTTGSTTTTTGSTASFKTNANEVIKSASGAVDNLPNLSGSGGSGYVDFINNATRGMFLAPGYQISSLPDMVEKRIKALYKNSFSGKIWVAYEHDAQGQVIATPPWGLVSVGHPYALNKGAGTKAFTRGHFVSHVAPILVKDVSEEEWNASKASDRKHRHRVQVAKDRWEQYYVLRNSLRWRGIVPANKSGSTKASAAVARPFVCQKVSPFPSFYNAGLDNSKGHDGHLPSTDCLREQNFYAAAGDRHHKRDLASGFYSVLTKVVDFIIPSTAFAGGAGGGGGGAAPGGAYCCGFPSVPTTGSTTTNTKKCTVSSTTTGSTTGGTNKDVCVSTSQDCDSSYQRHLSALCRFLYMQSKKHTR